MAVSRYTLNLSDGSVLTTLYALEIDGPGNISTPRLIQETRPEYAIIQITGLPAFKIAGNFVNRFPTGATFTVANSTSIPTNNGTYTVMAPGASLSFGDTIIPVAAIPNLLGCPIPAPSCGVVRLNSFVLNDNLTFRFTPGFTFTVSGPFIANIISANSVTDVFVVPGDLTATFTLGFMFDVINSGANDGTYTVTLASTYSSVTDETTIPVGVVPVTTGDVGQITSQHPNVGPWTVTAFGSYLAGTKTIIPVVATIMDATLPFGQISYTIGSSTSLLLPGKAVVNYGEKVLEDLVFMLEHFADSTPPIIPGLVGQLWYDTTLGPASDLYRHWDGVMWSSDVFVSSGTLTFEDPQHPSFPPAVVEITGNDTDVGLRIRPVPDPALGDSVFRVTDNAGAAGLALLRVEFGGYVSTTNRMAVADGTAPLPSYTFTSDLDTGLYHSALNEVSVAIGGIQKVKFDSTGVTVFSGFFSPGADTPATPEYTFTSDPDTGMYHPLALNTLGFSTGGTLRLSIDGLAVTSAVRILNISGSALLPAYSFTVDPDTGIFNNAVNGIGFVVGGQAGMSLASTNTLTVGTLAIPGTITGADGSSSPGAALIVEGGDGNGAAAPGGNITVRGGSATDGDGGSASVRGRDAVGASQVGGLLSLTAGNSTGAANGGTVNMTAGEGGATAIGGSVTINGGTGGSISGNGGAVNINGGISLTGTGGAVIIEGGSSVVSGTGGAVTVRGGDPVDGNGGAATVSGRNAAGTSRTGGSLTLTAGNSTDGTIGGVITMTAGSGGPTGFGGGVTISGGAGGTTSGGGGTVRIRGGLPVTLGAGGAVIVEGREGVGLNQTGGTLTLIGGAATGTGTGGAITLTAGFGGTTGTAGNIEITGGEGGSISGSGGTVTVRGGSATNGAGGAVTVQGRDGAGGTSAGGDVNVTAGAAVSTGTAGLITRSTTGGFNRTRSGNFTTAGDAQSNEYVLRTQTTNATATEMFLDGTGGTRRMIVASDSTWHFEVKVVARRTDANDESAAYKFEGSIDNNAGTTALVGTVLETVVAEDTAAWVVAVTADNTNDALIITVTGEIGKTIRWTAFVRTVEVIG